jgi:pre-mRNA-splicing factor SPF27
MSSQGNISLLQQYGANAWKVHNYRLEADATAAEAELERTREQVTQVNRDRKNAQVCLDPIVNF